MYKDSGERSDPHNYHPISLLPVISKVFESIINVALVRLLDSSGLFSDFQYGFRTSRSTADILTVISDVSIVHLILVVKLGPSLLISQRILTKCGMLG